MQTVGDIIKVIEEFAPLSLQMDYDNSGLIYGERDSEISGIMITLDVTPAVVAEAIQKGCNMIVSHHPVIFKPIQKIDTAYSTQKALVMAIKKDIAIYASHTNFDFAEGGLNDTLIRALGVENIEYIVKDDITSGRIGDIKSEKSYTLQSFAAKVGAITGDNNITTVGDMNRVVKRIAVINGSGGGSESTILQVKEAGADIFITSELKYSVVRLAKDINCAIIEVGHYDSEIGFIELMYNIIDKAGKARDVYKSEQCLNPYN